jgi:hypothetical protein
MPSVFSKFFKRKKSERSAVSSDSDSSTPSPVSANAPSSPLTALVAGSANHLNSIPQAADPNVLDGRSSPEDNTPASPHDSSSTLLAFDAPSTATTNDAPLQITKGQQKFRAEVINTNEAGKGAAQVYEGRQQFFAAVTNNNIATSNSNNSDYGNTNSTITGDAIIHCAADGTEIQISQRTTPNTLSPATPAGTTASQPPASAARYSPPGPTQQIVGSQVFHAEMTNNNTLGSGAAQVIDGDQEFWGPVVNNNSRTINSNNSNANNVNSTITGNTYRIRESARSAPAVDLSDLGAMLKHIKANQHGTPNKQARYLTDFSGQGAMPLPANANFSNAFTAASPEEQMNHQIKMAVAQALAQFSR